MSKRPVRNLAVAVLSVMTVMSALSSIASAHAGATGYQLGGVEKIEINGKNVSLTYTLPCASIDLLTFVVSTDDSGSMEGAVGVVYGCKEGPLKTFTTTVTQEWAESALFTRVIETGGSLVPMRIRSN